ncbi:hypothetical protein [Eggerthella sinensis]|uniref:hypothetical protein n=1 Tax=Eggerthella sinensis TaxID=242230 RepID=UPI0022E01241|nr:hypothetical protein [Eggerthella sinensis]
MDEETGCLMVQDPNIVITDGGTKGTTNTTIYIENETKGISFVLSSLNNDTGVLVVAPSEKSATFLSITAAEGLNNVLKQVTRGSTAKGNVYSVDLNALSDKISASDGDTEERRKVKGDIAQCEAGDDLALRVTTEDAKKPCVPSKANANIKWPEPVGALTIMVTNPYSAVVNAEGEVAANKDGEDEGEEADEGAGYTAPAVKAVAVSGGGAVGKNVIARSEDTTNSLRNTPVNQALVKENHQAGYQSYLGASIAASSVRNDDTFRFQATVGSYESDSKIHTYQIWELWLKRADNGEMMRVGYLSDNKWEWAKFTQDGVSYDYSPLDKCFTWYDKDNAAYSTIAGKDTDALNIVTVAFNASAFYAVAAEYPGLQLADGDDNASIYVRTAPKTSEVQTYFETLAASNPVEGNKLQSAFLSLGTEETSSRKNLNASTAAREVFEKEFGASSSDVSWVVSNQRTAGFDQGDAFLKDTSFQNVRVYYSIAPGVGFRNIKTYDGGTNNKYLTDVRSTQMTNVSLWLYRGASYSDLQIMSAAILQSDGTTAYTCRTANNYDFKLTTQEDYRFYRVLMYYDTDKDGKAADKLDIPDQYAPHIAADKVVISGANNKDVDSETVDVFKEWLTDEGVVYQSGDSLALHADQLKSQGTRLLAQYTPQKKSVGLMYLEFTDGAVSGYYGYLGDGDNNSIMGALPDDNAITDWGYFVVVPTGATRPTNETFGTDTTIVPLNIGGLKYDAYKITKITESSKLKNQTQTWTSSNEAWTKSATFTVNFNFATSIVKGADANGTLGKADAPYGVRTGVQFPLALKANGTPSIQPNYMASSFQQMHSIDLTGLLSTDYAYRPNNVFSGAYDGGKGKGFVIKGLSSRFIGEFNHRQGLFPIIQGAALRNIAVRVENDITIKWNSGVDAAFGCLAGVAVDSTIKDCSVASLLDSSIATITLAELKPQGGKYQDNEGNNIGGLVGYAKNTSIDSSSVSNISLNVKSSDSTWKTDSVRLGLVVGKLDAVEDADGKAVVYEGLSATSVTLVDEGASTTNTQSLGGIVGQLVVPDGGTVSASKWNVDTCVLEKPALGKRSLLLAGGFIGARIGTVTFVNCSCSDMVLKKPDGEQESLDTVLVGTDAIEDSASGDTDRIEDNEPVDADVIESSNSEKQL